jgi:hypothetical protein
MARSSPGRSGRPMMRSRPPDSSRLCNCLTSMPPVNDRWLCDGQLDRSFAERSACRPPGHGVNSPDAPGSSRAGPVVPTALLSRPLELTANGGQLRAAAVGGWFMGAHRGPGIHRRARSTRVARGRPRRDGAAEGNLPRMGDSASSRVARSKRRRCPRRVAPAGRQGAEVDRHHRRRSARWLLVDPGGGTVYDPRSRCQGARVWTPAYSGRSHILSGPRIPKRARSASQRLETPGCQTKN